MFDHPLSTPHAWADQAQVGDVLLFHFPSPDEPGPVLARPCLVIEESRNLRRRCLTLANSRPLWSISLVETSIDVIRPAELAAAGLDQSTAFDAYRALLISVHNASFAIHPETGTPIIGRLIGDSYERMQSVRAYLSTQSRIADRHRQELDNDLSGRGVTPRKPTLPEFPEE
ncbi:hypothetical protein [Pseudooceanicola sp. MF1-13]|uniref:hypothetical protein n=1 Tax=Pseudooceanicola sp. MF1-13 TaxID=3379095 RepID=UPI0038918613